MRAREVKVAEAARRATVRENGQLWPQAVASHPSAPDLARNTVLTAHPPYHVHEWLRSPQHCAVRTRAPFIIRAVVVNEFAHAPDSVKWRQTTF